MHHGTVTGQKRGVTGSVLGTRCVLRGVIGSTAARAPAEPPGSGTRVLDSPPVTSGRATRTRGGAGTPGSSCSSSSVTSAATGALGAGEPHGRDERVARELLDDGRDAVEAADVQVVPLGDVAGQHHAAALPGPGAHGAEDGALERLRLVDDDGGVGPAAAAGVVGGARRLRSRSGALGRRRRAGRGAGRGGGSPATAPRRSRTRCARSARAGSRTAAAPRRCG